MECIKFNGNEIGEVGIIDCFLNELKIEADQAIVKAIEKVFGNIISFSFMKEVEDFNIEVISKEQEFIDD